MVSATTSTVLVIPRNAKTAAGIGRRPRESAAVAIGRRRASGIRHQAWDDDDHSREEKDNASPCTDSSSASRAGSQEVGRQDQTQERLGIAA